MSELKKVDSTINQLFLYDDYKALKDTLPQLEHPFYALSKIPNLEEKTYRHKDNWFSVVPSSKGQPTIYDKDIMVYIVSQLMVMRNRGEINTLSSKDVLTIKAKDYFEYTGRTRGGKGYKDLRNAILRLKGTVYTTNIALPESTHKGEIFFTLIDGESKIVEKTDPRTKTTVVDYFEVSLSEWMIDAINLDQVLTLHNEYFKLKPVHKAIYELARKHVGDKKKQSLKLSTIHSKLGKHMKIWRLRTTIKDIQKNFKSGEFPHYDISIDADDMVLFVSNTASAKKATTDDDIDIRIPPFETEIFKEAKELAPNFDNYALHEEWQIWFTEEIRNGRVKGYPKVDDSVFVKAYLGFCKGRQRKLDDKKSGQTSLGF
jgi:hypothetical protein